MPGQTVTEVLQALNTPSNYKNIHINTKWKENRVGFVTNIFAAYV